jgi:hypothetical protein
VEGLEAVVGEHVGYVPDLGEGIPITRSKGKPRNGELGIGKGNPL